MARFSALIRQSSSQVGEIARFAMVAICGMALTLAGPALPF